MLSQMNSEIPLALAFDDVLLQPRRTPASSRSEVSVASTLVAGIDLKVPVISANTPWCTEAPLATAMAMLGGIGFIHRMIPAEQQAAEVRKTKEHAFDPATAPYATVDSGNRLRVGAAVGVRGDYLDRAELVLEAGADILVVDVAHGHADHVLKSMAELRKRFQDIRLMVGNVATADGVRDLIEAGADAIKVGVGPGSVCSTRTVTGAGVPQLSAVLECAAEAKSKRIPVVADGGIRSSGDITKALAAGASTVMLGKLLAGAKESAALLIEDPDGRRYKITTGFVTLGVELTLKRLEGKAITQEEFERYTPEGVEATFDYSGPAEKTVSQLMNGLRSGISYCGGLSVRELQENARFVRITSAGKHESRPHVQDGVAVRHPDYAGKFIT